MILNTQNNQKNDFYILIVDFNICIEYDGIQHFKPIFFFGGIKAYNELIIKDKIKTNYCMINNIKLIRIPYYANIEDFINDEKILK
ncbi:hypothetical protein M0Q97_06115 [Candidatus Dojkabacteria bacterium]|jgi:hypothetical protein|nr:hypothetical protein [Candidatus Dojkabacteria bacterium]